MDLTSKFKQVCQIVEDELHIKKVNSGDSSPHLRHDEVEFNSKFIKDGYQLNKMIKEFRSEINNIRPKYLLIDQGDEDEKDNIDDQSSMYISQLKNMYEKLRNTNKFKTEKDEEKLQLRFSLKSDELKLYMITMIEIRLNIISFLSNSLKITTEELTEMKQIRLNKKKQLSQLSNYTTTTSIQIIEEEEDEKKEEPQFTQTQLKDLAVENKNLLIANLQDNLVKIERLHNSVVDVLSLLGELNVHLNEQSSQISNIIENNEFITSDLQQSNKHLLKLADSMSDRGNYLMYLLIFSGIMVLLIDFIKP